MSELPIGFKFVYIAGQGFVVLKDPERFPSIFSPVNEADCFLLCHQAAYIHFREGVAQHHIKQDMKIGSSVSVKSIIKIIPYLDRPVQIVLHNVKNGKFPTKKGDCSIFTHEEQGDRTLIHIGHNNVHYFLINETKYLTNMSADDFQRFDSKNDEFPSKLIQITQ